MNLYRTMFNNSLKKISMGDVKNLIAEEAIEKINDLVKANDICLFTTDLTNLPLATCPMSTQEVDDEGNLWFFSSASSEHNRNLASDNRVQLFYSNKSNYEFLSLYGEASIIKDKKKAKELWNPMVKTWFQQGVDDPDLTLIKVTPMDAYYWDTKSNKLVSLFKIMTGALIGKRMDNGVEGSIKI